MLNTRNSLRLFPLMVFRDQHNHSQSFNFPRRDSSLRFLREKTDERFGSARNLLLHLTVHSSKELPDRSLENDFKTETASQRRQPKSPFISAGLGAGHCSEKERDLALVKADPLPVSSKVIGKISVRHEVDSRNACIRDSSIRGSSKVNLGGPFCANAQVFLDRAKPNKRK